MNPYPVIKQVMEITYKMLLYATELIIILTTSPELVFLCAKNTAMSYLHTTNEYEI
jgi:hypothetical protein